MNIKIIQKLDSIIECMNTKQQIIANRAKLNKNYRFFESQINGVDEIFFEDISTKEIFNLISYIKVNCGCD
jgi:hypothetical protein